MGWENARYRARCGQCGHEGAVIHSSDDWGRQARRYEGFENVLPGVDAVARKRADSRQNSGRCRCGSTDIVRGVLF